MSLRWKFWSRTKNASPAPPAAAPRPAAAWLPLTSNKELLGLQRIIGNQAVLQLLALRSSQSTPEAASQPPRQSFWRKLRRD